VLIRKLLHPDTSGAGSLPEDGEMQLSDARRVKILSPGAMVFKRFVRNKLAVAGFIILLAVLLFSVFGPIFMPYAEGQVFKEYSLILKEYATAKYNKELRYTLAAGTEFPTNARTSFIAAISEARKSTGSDILENGTTFAFEDSGGNK